MAPQSLPEAIEDCYDAERRCIKPDKLLGAVKLACVCTVIGELPDPEFFAAINRSVERLEREFRDGEIKHLEDGLGMSRPRKWRQPDARRRARYKPIAIGKLVRLLNDGGTTPEVFHRVAEDLPVSASRIEKWWYSYSEADREAIKNTLK
jgi:hypothetical protein